MTSCQSWVEWPDRESRFAVVGGLFSFVPVFPVDVVSDKSGTLKALHRRALWPVTPTKSWLICMLT